MTRRQPSYGFVVLYAFLFACVSASGFFVVPTTALAQIETVGPIDTNSQDSGGGSSDKKDDSVNLAASKYTPTGLSATVQGENAVALHWSDNAKKEDGYDIQRRTPNASWRIVARVDRNVETYTDRTVVSGTTYIYRVAAFDSENQTTWSNQATAKTAGITPAEKAAQKEHAALQKQEQTLQQEFDVRLEQEVQKEVKKARQEILTSVTPSTCTLAQVPVQDVDKAFRERCEQLTGRVISDTGDTKRASLIHAILNNTRARLLAVFTIFFIILNNVIWHITHKTAKNRLRGEF